MKQIDILLITYQRSYLLEKVLKSIYERTNYPHRIIVVDNASTDNTKDILKRQQKIGAIYKYIEMPSNGGQIAALNEGMKYVESEMFVTTQDDLLPPDLKPCWLERIKHLLEGNPDYGAICMRIQRTSRLEIDESKDLIDTHKSMPSVFRIQWKKDFLTERPFGRLKHWESHSYAERMKEKKKKMAMATHLYSDHLGFLLENKGYRKDFIDYYTYSPERVKQGEEKPYPDIDPKTNEPIKINHNYDTREQEKREKRESEAGKATDHSSRHTQKQRDLLVKWCVGHGIDVGCGPRKIHPDAIGIDLFNQPGVDMPGISGDDLWMFENESLDYVVASHSLEHFADTKKTLKEWDRVLKKGGTLGIIVPDGELRPKTITEQAHKVALTKAVLGQLIKRFLNYKIIELRNMPEVEGEKAQKCILAVIKKRNE